MLSISLSRFLRFFFLSLVVSCSPKPQEGIDVSIDIKKEWDFHFSDIFESYKIIPLETSEEVLIGGVDKILVGENLIFLLDKRVSKSVFVFNEYGELTFKISSQGFGPGELYSPTNMALNHDNQELIVVDGRQGKFLVYDYGGNFKKEIKKAEMSSPYDINILGDRFFLVDGLTEKWEERLKVTDENLTVQEIIDVFQPNDYKLVNGKKASYLYELSGRSGFFYKEPLNSRIIELRNGSKGKHYNFFFTGEQFKPIAGKVYQAVDFYQEFGRADKYALGDHMVNARDFSLISINKGEEMKIALWNRLSGEVMRVNQFLNDMDGVLPNITGIPPSNGSADLFIWALHPRDLASMSYRDEEQGQKYDRFAQGHGIKSDDNPILFVYKMKAAIE